MFLVKTTSSNWSNAIAECDTHDSILCLQVINVYLALLKERETLANDHLDMNLPRCLFLDTFFYERVSDLRRGVDAAVSFVQND